jgi:hypothetical protein
VGSAARAFRARGLSQPPRALNAAADARWEGLLFLFYYGAYVSYVLLDASGREALPRFSSVMTLFAIPLTVLTLGVVIVRSLRGRRAALP